jgi:hypothetical protein
MTTLKDLEKIASCEKEIQESLKKHNCVLVPTSAITTKTDGTLVATATVRIEKIYEPPVDPKYPN